MDKVGNLNKVEQKDVINNIVYLQQAIGRYADSKGWWDKETGEDISPVHVADNVYRIMDESVYSDTEQTELQLKKVQELLDNHFGVRRNDGEMIALMHSELSEALEGLRKDADSKIDQGNVAEELADCVIRIFDFCEHRGINLGKAIVDKHHYNITRPRMHGGKKF